MVSHLYIANDDLRNALNALVNPAQGRAFESLVNLVMVDAFLLEQQMSLESREAREHAVYAVLTAIITRQLHQHRTVHEVDAASTAQTRRAYEQHIHRDGQTGVMPLIYWSLLYHCYVRAELDINLVRFSQIINVTERTARRYLESALPLLKQVLLDQEIAARQAYQRDRLLARLPQPPRRFYGRNQVLEELSDVVLSCPKATVCVSGAVGIGKTAFLKVAARRLIETHQFHHAIWIERPATADEIMSYIGQQINAHDIRAALNLVDMLVVIDDLPPALLESLDVLVDATVIVSCQQMLDSGVIDHHLILGALDKVDMLNLAYAYIRQFYDVDSASDIAHLVDEIGGNPGRLRQRILGQQHKPLDYTWLSDDERHVWLSLALSPPEPLSLVELNTLWPDIDRDVLASLAVRRLILLDLDKDERYSLPYAMMTQLETLYRTNIEVQIKIQQIISGLKLHTNPNLAARTINHLCRLDWLDISPETKRRWLDALGDYDVVLWFNMFDDVDDDLQIGVLLRRYGQWGRAAEWFQNIIVKAGGQGDFLRQAQARRELSVILRYQGAYAEAKALLDKAATTAERLQNYTLLDYVHLDYAQIAIALMRPDLAWAHLQALSGMHTGVKYLKLLGEIHLLADRHEECRDAAWQALHLAAGQRKNVGQLHDLIGRSYDTDYASAHHHFMTALSYFDAENDLFGTARCYSNLAVQLMKHGDSDKADHLLRQAKDIQAKLGDRVGLVVTERNLFLLSRSYN